MNAATGSYQSMLTRREVLREEGSIVVREAFLRGSGTNLSGGER